MHMEKNLNLRLCRPVQTRIKLKKGDKPLGLSLTCNFTGNLTVGGEIEEGIVKEYNVAAPPELRLAKGHDIISVNGVSGSTDTMVDEMRSAKVLDIVFIR